MPNNPYICTPKIGLTHGVTVALQILVLSVKVRILMGQRNPASIVGFFFLLLLQTLETWYQESHKPGCFIIH